MKNSLQNSIKYFFNWLPIYIVVFYSIVVQSASSCRTLGGRQEPTEPVWNIQQLLDFETDGGIVYHGTSIGNAVKLLSSGIVGSVRSGEIALFVTADYFQATHHALRKGGTFSAILPIKIKKLPITALNEATKKGTYFDRFKYDVIITPDVGRPGSPFRDLYLGNTRILELPTLDVVLNDMARRVTNWNQTDSPVGPTEFWKQYKNFYYALPIKTRGAAPVPEAIRPNDPTYLEIID